MGRLAGQREGPWAWIGANARPASPEDGGPPWERPRRHPVPAVAAPGRGGMGVTRSTGFFEVPGESGEPVGRFGGAPRGLHAVLLRGRTSRATARLGAVPRRGVRRHVLRRRPGRTCSHLTPGTALVFVSRCSPPSQGPEGARMRRPGPGHDHRRSRHFGRECSGACSARGHVFRRARHRGNEPMGSPGARPRSTALAARTGGGARIPDRRSPFRGRGEPASAQARASRHLPSRMARRHRGSSAAISEGSGSTAARSRPLR